MGMIGWLHLMMGIFMNDTQRKITAFVGHSRILCRRSGLSSSYEGPLQVIEIWKAQEGWIQGQEFNEQTQNRRSRVNDQSSLLSCHSCSWLHITLPDSHIPFPFRDRENGHNGYSLGRKKGSNLSYPNAIERATLGLRYTRIATAVAWRKPVPQALGSPKVPNLDLREREDPWMSKFKRLSLSPRILISKNLPHYISLYFPQLPTPTLAGPTIRCVLPSHMCGEWCEDVFPEI